MKNVAPLLRNVASWFAMCALALYALVLLNGAFFSAWMSGGPLNPYPDGWALRAKAQSIWALASALGALGLFKVIRRYPAAGVRTWLVLAVAAILTATPFIAREVLIDQCLDQGGRWNYGGLQCER
jgi:hypothetical protein